MNKKWFTLVELIVAIVTVIILSIIAFEILNPPKMAQEEKLNKIQECQELWFWYRQNARWNIICNSYKEDKVMNCIKEYTRWLDEKYNNPDTVTDLREDDYSNVVKTCNEIFWNKNSTL